MCVSVYMCDMYVRAYNYVSVCMRCTFLCVYVCVCVCICECACVRESELCMCGTIHIYEYRI